MSSFITAVLSIVILHAGAGVAHADVGLSIGVGDTYVNIIGQTSPSSFITIKDGDQVVGTTVSDINGNFTKLLGAQNNGIHLLTIFAKSNTGALSDSAIVSANFREQETTDVFVFLPTTIALSGSEIAPNNALQIRGETFPGGNVQLYIDQDAPLDVRVDASGNWSLQINSNKLTAGNHSIVAYVTDPSGQQSSPTVPRFFTILSAASNSPGVSNPSNPTFSGSKTPTPPTITIPKDGTTTSEKQITIVGISESYRQIEIWRNSQMIGSVFANKNGGWSMPIRLQAGLNEITARACHASVCSKNSRIVSVYYIPAEIVRDPFRVIFDRYRFDTEIGKHINMSVRLANGNPPYTYEIDWGDGDKQLVSSKDTVTSFTHAYSISGRYSGKVIITDSEGLITEGFFSVNVRDVPNATNFWPIWGIILSVVIAAAFIKRKTLAKYLKNLKSIILSRYKH